MSTYPQTGPLPAYYDILGVASSATTEEIRTAYKKESLRTHPDRQPNATPTQRKAFTEKFQAVADAYYVLSDPTRRKEYDVLLRLRGKQRASSSSTANAPGGSNNDSQDVPGGFPFSTDPSVSAAFFEQFKKYFADAQQAWTGGGAAGSSSSSSKDQKKKKRRGGTGATSHDSEDEVEIDMDGEEEDDEERTAFDQESWNDGARPDANGVFGNVFEELLRPEVQRTAPWWTYLGSMSGATIGFILANVPGALAGGLAGNRLGAIRDAKGRPVIQVFAALEGGQKAEILKALALKVFGSLSAM